MAIASKNNVTIGTVDGDIILTGDGGDGSANSDYGIYLLNTTVIESTGTGASAGTVTLNGTGRGSTWGIGVVMNNSADVTRWTGISASPAPAPA